MVYKTIDSKNEKRCACSIYSYDKNVVSHYLFKYADLPKPMLNKDVVYAGVCYWNKYPFIRDLQADSNYLLVRFELSFDKQNYTLHVTMEKPVITFDYTKLISTVFLAHIDK